ncbi:phosphodiester glycosidase family protein [Paenibacillus sp. J2TS4]|uniref:phosphodiester glycosidase family protein n=1 Tax=Paenibacillus sp. J2TS4 TaxID=2807194 RepID=UPI001B1DE803|nr:phosphodiester glycosidase family protein [Paenibacillus sp. J2TS4]GIP35395.1 hypothetical protein J2TS4_46050 [Paenibacillus sp. J2TS4]
MKKEPLREDRTIQSTGLLQTETVGRTMDTGSNGPMTESGLTEREATAGTEAPNSQARDRPEASGWETKQEIASWIAPGITWFRRTLAYGEMRQAAHVLEIDPAERYLQLKPVSSGGKVTRLETVGRLLGELQAGAEQSQVIAGVNADFFSSLGVPSGLQMIDGEIITCPALTKVLLAVAKDGTVLIRSRVALQARLGMEGKETAPLELDRINRTRTLNHTNDAFIYTWRFGESTRTPPGGVEAVLSVEDPDYKLIPGQPLTGRVEAVEEGANSKLTRGSVVISATGDKGKWLRQHLVPGMTIRLTAELDQGLNAARQVVSGNSTLAFVLLQGGRIPESLFDPDVAWNSDRHPRTMLAVKQGKLYAVTIDGRQPGHSDGVTLAEGAAYLQSLGMEDAINIDGGGSTACYVRRPGDRLPSLVNRPSDGFERAVGNALAVLTTAPASGLASLAALPEAPVRAAPGSRLPFTVKGRDDYGHPVPVEPDRLQWAADEAVGAVDAAGVLTAASRPGSGTVTVRCGDVSHAWEVTVTDRIARLALEPPAAVVEPGGTAAFRPQAYDADGQPVRMSAEVPAWSADGAVTVSADGVAQAADAAGEGCVVAEYRGLRAEAAVHVGKPPRVVDGFESLDGLRASGVRAVPGSVTLTRVARPQPVRYGTFAAKLTYDFTAVSGPSRAVVDLLDEHGEPGRPVEGEPCRLGLWVYGDSKGHRLRMSLADTRQVRHLTFVPGTIAWTGWKYVYVEVPQNTVFPVRILNLHLLETDDTKKDSGVLYLDQLRAEYVDLDEDVEGPVFGSLTPPPGSVHKGWPQEMGAIVSDEGSGVDPSSIRVWMNGTAASYKSSKQGGKTRIILTESSVGRTSLSDDGEVRIRIEASDMSRNPAVPAAEWTFRMEAESSSHPRNLPSEL